MCVCFISCTTYTKKHETLIVFLVAFHYINGAFFFIINKTYFYSYYIWSKLFFCCFFYWEPGTPHTTLEYWPCLPPTTTTTMCLCFFGGGRSYVCVWARAEDDYDMEKKRNK